MKYIQHKNINKSSSRILLSYPSLRYVYNYYNLIFIGLIPILFLLGCVKDKKPWNIGDGAEIISWKFGTKVATINGTDITITLPFGTDITALKADVKLSPKATINPDPSKDNDYTNTKKFTVTAEDGTTSNDYKVTVTVNAPNNEANIISWKFGTKVATINGTDITITLPFGTDITALKADVKLSPGSSISLDSTQSKDYTNPATFTVTAEDGTTSNDYKVSVSVEYAIVSWTGGWRDDDAYTAIINQSTGEINIDVNSADFIYKVTTSSGVTITPNPQTVTNWTKEQSFTATGNGKTKTYKVKVTVKGKDIIKVTNEDIIPKISAEISRYGNTANYNYIDVSDITDMGGVFYNQINFNGDITKWDVSNVISMRLLFYLANSFNQNIGKWDVSNVQNMYFMFNDAQSFNQNIEKWNVSKVKNMGRMFYAAKSFNQNIKSSWTVNQVTNCSGFSDLATAFQDANKPTFTACTE